MPDDGAVDNEWDAETYDDRTSFVYEYGEDLVDLLDPREGERVLDLGCGTGHLAARIVDRGSTVVGVDRSTEMVEAVRDRYPELPVRRADARTMSFEEPFDAVFSNAVLHWITDQDAATASVRDCLRPDGRFVAELGGAGNVETITDAVVAELAECGHDAEHLWYFPRVGEHAALLESHGFEVRYARLFDRPTELEGGAEGLRRWLETFGDALFEPLSEEERGRVVSAVEDRLRPEVYRDGRWVADYRRLRFVAVRE